MKHQINETHLGSTATRAQAVEMADALTALGYPSECTPTSGGVTSVSMDGETREIPDSVWFKALLSTMKTGPQFILSRDRNGNKTVKVKAGNARAFSIQTHGNLPATHSNGICDATRGEVSKFVGSFGTDHQRKALAAFGL